MAGPDLQVIGEPGEPLQGLVEQMGIRPGGARLARRAFQQVRAPDVANEQESASEGADRLLSPPELRRLLGWPMPRSVEDAELTGVLTR